MRLAWIWFSTFVRLVCCGESYYALPRGRVRMSAWIAGVVTRTCRDIRRAR